MKYKKSQFNIEIDRLEDNSLLLYNTFSGIFGIMDIETQQIYDNLQDVDVCEIQNTVLKKNCETLIQYGYIVENDVDELARFKLERIHKRMDSKVLHLTIAPTMACNMRCPYCYENKNETVMSEETQSQLLDFVKEHFLHKKSLEKLHVTWYGGEPLLQKNIIYKLTEAFLEICKEFHAKYNADIITNGALLNKDTAWKLYKECYVRQVQITIDGMPEAHNKRRIFVDGTGSFDVIIRNIEECRNFMPICVRMNIDKTNLEDAERFLQFAVDDMHWNKNPRVYIAPVDSYTENSAHMNDVCFSRLEFAKMKTKFQKMNYAISRDRVEPEFFPRPKLLHCGAEYENNYVIDPEGCIYTCWMVLGDKTHKCGHIKEPLKVTTEYYKWISSELPHKCEECAYLPMCAGGCGYFRIIKKSEANCACNFYSYKDTLLLAYNDYIRLKAK